MWESPKYSMGHRSLFCQFNQPVSCGSWSIQPRSAWAAEAVARARARPHWLKRQRTRNDNFPTGNNISFILLLLLVRFNLLHGRLQHTRTSRLAGKPPNRIIFFSFLFFFMFLIRARRITRARVPFLQLWVTITAGASFFSFFCTRLRAALESLRLEPFTGRRSRDRWGSFSRFIFIPRSLNKTLWARN